MMSGRCSFLRAYYVSCLKKNFVTSVVVVDLALGSDYPDHISFRNCNISSVSAADATTPDVFSLVILN